MDIKMIICKKCKANVHPYAEFPGQLCLKCYETSFNKIPLDKLPMPNFIKTIKIK